MDSHKPFLVGTTGLGARRYSIVVRGELGPRRSNTLKKSLAVYKAWAESHGSEAVSASTERGTTAQEAGHTAVKRVKAAGKVQTKNYVVLKEHIWELQRVLDGKKSGLRKTYKNQAEANDKVLVAERKHRDKAPGILAAYCERFDATTKDLCDIDKV